MVYTLRFFPSSKCSLFHNSNVIVSCIIHILYTECAKIKKNNSGGKKVKSFEVRLWTLVLSSVDVQCGCLLSSITNPAVCLPLI